MKQINWGVVASIPLLLIGFFAAFIMFVGSVMGGGGCEGQPSPCRPDFGHMWTMLGVILFSTGLFTVVSYKIVNNVVKKHRVRKLSRKREKG